MIVFPNAKINIGLDLSGRRPDGYHLITTVMIPVPWTDVLELVPAKDGVTSLVVTGRFVDCPPEKNLVMRAFHALQDYVGRALDPVEIHLHKVIPDGAGLGGGSADAAFLLRALNEMQSLGLTTEELCRLAASLGADCPFFIHNVPALATGIGTDLQALPHPIEALRGCWILIAKPPVGMSTREAYQAIDAAPQAPSSDLPASLSLPLDRWQGTVKNDFEPVVAARLPEVADLIRSIRDMGATYVSMSGSGTAVYGIFERDILSDDLTGIPAEYDVMRARLD